MMEQKYAKKEQWAIILLLNFKSKGCFLSSLGLHYTEITENNHLKNNVNYISQQLLVIQFTPCRRKCPHSSDT